MDEAQRFLRFVLPGILFMVVALGGLLLLRPDLLSVWLKYLENMDALGTVLGALATSGGLGFIFSVVHHEFEWRRASTPIDHTELIRRLIKTGKLEVITVDASGALSTLQASDVRRENAHDIVTTLWHVRIGDDPIKSASAKMTSLLDVAYSLGIASWAIGIGLISALLSAACLWQPLPGPCLVLRLFILLVVGSAAWWTFRLNYWRVARFATNLISGTLMDAVIGSGVTVKTFIQGR